MGRSNRLFEYRGYWITRRAGTPQLYAGWYDGTGQTKHKTLGTGDIEAAQDKLIEFVRLNETMRQEHPKDVGLRTVLHRYYHNHAVKLASVEAAYYAVLRWDEFFGDVALSEITPARQREFAAWLAERGSSSGYRILATGKAALSRAEREGELLKAPNIDLSIAPEGEDRQRVLTIKEIVRLIHAAVRPHEQAYLLLALATAARPSTILELTSFQLDFENGLIALNPPDRRQTTKLRPTIPMIQAARPALASLPTGPLVTYKDRALREITSPFRRMCTLAGFDLDVSAYTLRHTVATEMTKRGAGIWQVGEFMGNAGGGPKTTRRYVKVGPDHLADAARALEHLFSDLKSEFGDLPSDHLFNRVRASDVQATKLKLVEPSGIEPLTSTMPLYWCRRNRRNSAAFRGNRMELILICSPCSTA